VLAFSPDGRTIAASSDEGVDIWNVTSRKKRRFSQLNDAIGALGFSSDGRTLTAAGAGGLIGIWTVSTGKYTSSAIPLADEMTVCNSMAVSPNGHDVACGYYDGNNGGMLVWDAKKNKQRTSWPGAQTSAGVAFSPDGKTLAFSGAEGDSVELWNIASHRMTAEWDASPMLTGLAFSPDGRTLAVPSHDSDTSEDTIDIRKLPGADKATTLRRIDTPETLALSRDGTMLVTAEGSVGLLWKVRSHKQLASWTE
jgi:WD40 repeat protein